MFERDIGRSTVEARNIRLAVKHVHSVTKSSSMSLNFSTTASRNASDLVLILPNLREKIGIGRKSR